MTARARAGRTIICVSAVVRDGDRILLVRQSKGHPLAGQWTVPWGRLENGESPAAAALREVREEGGIDAEIEGLLGVQELPDPWRGWVALVYLCRRTGGTPGPLDAEIDAAACYSLDELNALTEPIEPWSNWLIRRVFAGTVTTIGAADSSNPLRHHGTYL